MVIKSLDVITDSSTKAIKKIISNAPKAEHILALQIAKDTRPYVPADTESLNNRTRVDGNRIIYPGPYARYLYFGKYMVDEKGNGPMHFVDKNGNEVIRYRKGSKLHATDRNLVFTTDVHPNAQSHWLEASKADNIEKWEEIAKTALIKTQGT